MAKKSAFLEEESAPVKAVSKFKIEEASQRFYWVYSVGNVIMCKSHVSYATRDEAYASIDEFRSTMDMSAIEG